MRILNLLAEAPARLRLKDIAGPLGLNTSTCLNILRTLAAAGVVQVDRATKTYGPGLVLVSLARAALSRDARVLTAEPLLADVAARHSVTAMLWQRAGDDSMVMLAVATGEGAWKIQAQVGSRASLLQGSMGRIMATRGQLTDEEQLAHFQAVRWDRPLTFEDFLSQARLARERGWASDDGYFHRSMTSISVPVVDADGTCDAVLTAAMFAGQHNLSRRDRIAADLMRVALAIQPEPFAARRRSAAAR